MTEMDNSEVQLPYWDDKIFFLHEFSEVAIDVDEGLVTTNGCFDLFHVGHLHNLLLCSRYAQRLYVGLNSDASVARLKGPDRPVVDQINRASIVAALPFVDKVIIFDCETPVEFLKVFKPAFHCKGEDYRDRVKEIPEYELLKEWGGSIELIKLVESSSTTGLIEKVRS